MANNIPINQSRLSETLDELRAIGLDSALTTEVIEKYMGGFRSNKGITVGETWNTQFSEYLKENARRLNIREVTVREKVKMNNRYTSASRWQLKKKD